MANIDFNCREVTRLVLEAEERPLTEAEQSALKLHWAECIDCERFRDQTEAMRVAMSRWRRYREE